jgi:hypothetical protein
MYKNDVGKGGVCAHEAYEATKKIFFLLCEYMGPTSFLYKSILLLLLLLVFIQIYTTQEGVSDDHSSTYLLHSIYIYYII